MNLTFNSSEIPDYKLNKNCYDFCNKALDNQKFEIELFPIAINFLLIAICYFFYHLEKYKIVDILFKIILVYNIFKIIWSAK